MSEVVLIEELDQAIEAMFRNQDALPASSDSHVAELVGIAVELRALPRADFKIRLHKQLNEAAMGLATEEGSLASEEQMETNDTSPASDSVRATFRTVTPYLTVADVPAEIEFVTKVFGAEGKLYGLGSQGGYHSEYQIGDSMVMIGGGGEGSSWKGTANPASLHMYVEDVDAVYEKAVQAGATSLMPPTNQEYGDRDAAVIDVGGNHWYIGTSQGPAYKPPGVSDLMPYLHPTGAPRMIDFLKQAFAAEEVFVYQSPDGIVHHAKLAIGNSIVEMGEAHAQWQPMPMVFMLYVDDVEAWYARAMKAAGVISLSAPKAQAYGDRVGAVKDPFNNVWYIGTRGETEKSGSTESRRISMAAPKLFRIALQVADLDQASAFYSKLLDDPGRRIRGSRHYFDCGPVILAIVDVTAGHLAPQPIPDYVYFAISNLDQIYERAKAMNCLAKEDVHGADAGAIVTRPWGERSFYAEDPWGNGLCFVEEQTLFTGK
jgi:uncharacterized glyoxalase superfamily protein PhnB